jgi:diacylglycerol kinase family enzyme
MPASQANSFVSAGTVRGKDADLTYDPENGGTLTVTVSEGEENIHNRNIIAIIDDKKYRQDAKFPIQKILLLTNDEASAPESPIKVLNFEAVNATNLPQSFVDANSLSPRTAHLSSVKIEEPAFHLYVIISVGSGTGQAQQYFDDVIKPAFSAIGIQESGYDVHTTSSSTSITDFIGAVVLPRANEGRSQTILLLSGDGGVVDTLNVLLSSSRSLDYVKPVIGLVAMGTGNALANSTGLNSDLTRGLRHFFRGQTCSLPTFTATFSPGSEYLVDEGRRTEPLATSSDGRGTVYGAVVCSWALHASLVADSDTTEYRKYGTKRFQMAAKELLAPSDGSAPHVYKGKITLTKRNEHGEGLQQALEAQEFMYILATLVSNLEETLIISPHSRPLDGQIRLLHFGPISSADVMRILGLAFQGGGHVDDEAVSYDSIDGMRIDFDDREQDGRWRRVCVDGKIIRVSRGGWVEMSKNDSTADVLDIIA